MKVDVARITIDFKTGNQVCEIVGEDTVDERCFNDGKIKLFTGKSVDELIDDMRKEVIEGRL